MSGVDGFTAGLFLEAFKSTETDEDRDKLHDMFKEIKADPENGPTEAQREAVTALIGKKVVVVGCVGIVKRLNENTRGFYPGGRYPAIIELVEALETHRENAVGNTFEYGLEQVELYSEESYHE